MYVFNGVSYYSLYGIPCMSTIMYIVNPFLISEYILYQLGISVARMVVPHKGITILYLIDDVGVIGVDPYEWYVVFFAVGYPIVGVASLAICYCYLHRGWY